MILLKFGMQATDVQATDVQATDVKGMLAAKII